MTEESGEGSAWTAAFLLALPALLFPVFNPDLFWHLSAGGWIVEHRAVPRADFLSFTAAGAPWQDFEWLSQLLLQGVFSAAGMGGLWLLKVGLLGACWALLDRTLRLHEIPPAARAGALGLWGVGALCHPDLRPELFSLLFFCAELLALETYRLGRWRPKRRDALLTCGFFALWSNLHLGFLLGLFVLVVSILTLPFEDKGKEAKAVVGLFGAAAAGTLLNPYGWGPHLVAWRHWEAGGELSRYIAEWRPLALDNPLYWPMWALLLLAAGLAVHAARVRRRPLKEWPWTPLVIAAFLAESALAHKRMTPFFNSGAVVAAALLAREGGLLEGKPLRRGLLWGLLLYGGFAAWAVPRINWTGFFNYKFVPRLAAEFLERERPAVEPLRIFNEWEWGGYLAWRLRPWYKVSRDGRYLFHDQLGEAAKAFSDPGLLEPYLARRGLNGVLVRNLDTMFPTTRVYPDKSTRTFLRPWYALFLPKERWALVYWDAGALFFVDRRAAPAAWLSAHEYRWLRPRDEAALSDALSRREAPEKGVAEERARHESEVRPQG